jgi:hypothetical protein
MAVNHGKFLVSHTFHGGRFADHGVDLDVLEEVLRYKCLLVETAKDLWHRENPSRERLPKNFEDGLKLKFYELTCNCATIPLFRQVIDDQPSLFGKQDELVLAVNLVAETIECANLDRSLPESFPRQLIPLFADYGKSLADDEWIEQAPEGCTRPVRYDAIARERLQRYADNAYEDYVDLTGIVTMARVSKPKMAIELSDGREIEAAFRPDDEEIITTALKDHATAKLRVIGLGSFSGGGLLLRVAKVTSVALIVGGAEIYDEAVKPIWEQFEDILAKVPADEWAKLPVDAAENHDRYLSQPPGTGK